MTTEKIEDTASEEVIVETTTSLVSQQRVEQPVYPTPVAPEGDAGIGDLTERVNADLAKGYIGIRPGD